MHLKYAYFTVYNHNFLEYLIRIESKTSSLIKDEICEMLT